MARSDQSCAGEPSTWAIVPGTCTVVLTPGEGEPIPIDFSFLLDKVVIPNQMSTFSYNEATHTVTHNGVPYQLNCGQFSFDPQLCQLKYIDEKGVERTYLIPQDQFLYSAASRTLTILAAKGGASLVIPLGVPSSDVSLSLIGPCLIEFAYGEKKCQIQLPDAFVGCEYNPSTNAMTLISCSGEEKQINFAKASLDCNTLDSGTRVFVFNDGCGGTPKMWSIEAPVIDTDGAELINGVLILTYGGDGNSQTLRVPICEIVAAQCNATVTYQNDDGSWGFIDNAGKEFNFPATQPEVFVGQFAPSKDAGLKIWFNPQTCVVRYCDDAGNWIEPRNVVCQEDEPPTAKGGPDLWYKESTCCFSILCDGVWLGVNGVVMDALIQQLCVQIGDGPLIPVGVDIEGKAVIRIPAYPVVPTPLEYCIKLGNEGTPIVATPDHEKENKVNLILPEYPEVSNFTYCIQVGEAAPINGVINPAEPTKVIFQLPAYPEAQSLPAYCVQVGEDDVINGVINPEEPGKIVFRLPAYPEAQQLPTYCVRIGDGEPIAGTIDPAEPDKVVFQLPEYPAPATEVGPILDCGGSEPATDGTEGIFWMNEQTGCLHALCDGVWKATNGTDIAA